jgi:hypothetical protein
MALGSDWSVREVDSLNSHLLYGPVAVSAATLSYRVLLTFSLQTIIAALVLLQSSGKVMAAGFRGS